MGADRAVLLEVEADPEPLAAAKYLATVIRREKPDLVLMGKQSTDHDYGQTPAMLAGLLDWPQAMQASRIQSLGGSLQVTCELDKGTEVLSVPLPAVVSADLRLNTPRFASLPAVMKAKKKLIDVVTLAEIEASQPVQHLQVLRAELPPARSGGRVLPDVTSLVAALRKEARVL
jgi:electron transfer flavoprotein beta subunit